MQECVSTSTAQDSSEQQTNDECVAAQASQAAGWACRFRGAGGMSVMHDVLAGMLVSPLLESHLKVGLVVH